MLMQPGRSLLRTTRWINLYNQVFRELLTFMIEDPRAITRATRLIWVAHNLERSADRVTNICERVIYLVTGKMEEIRS
jgi:phosphate transport system protein